MLQAQDTGAKSTPTIDPFLKQVLESVKETHDLIRESSKLRERRSKGKKSTKRMRDDDNDGGDGDDEGDGGGGEGGGEDDSDDGDGMEVDPIGNDGLPRVPKTKPAHRGKEENQVAVSIPSFPLPRPSHP